MSYENIRLEVAEGVACVTLDRPEKLNAYTTAMGEEIVDAFRRLRDDPEVRAVILTGAGRGFCAGVDLEHLKAHQAGQRSGDGPRLGEEDFLRVFPLELLDYPKPTLAAINGHAIGVGVTMALPFDLRIAAEEAKLGLTFVKLGILPGLGSTHLLPRLVGRARALELVTTGRILRAPEACRIGLVQQVVPAAELMETVRALAREYTALRPEVVSAARRALLYGADHGMEESMRNEERASAELRRLRETRS